MSKRNQENVDKKLTDGMLSAKFMSCLNTMSANGARNALKIVHLIGNGLGNEVYVATNGWCGVQSVKIS